MKKQSLTLKAMLAVAILAIVSLTPALAEGKLGAAKTTTGEPLKIYILAGQSNMEGQVRPWTIDAMRNDPEVAELYKDMTDKDGTPITVEDAYIVYGDISGKLTCRFGSTQLHGTMAGIRKMGPEYTFGIYMQKYLKEPILIIKTAWGGKSLIKWFRSPSAGEIEIEADKHGNKAGHYYRQMIKEVKDVLADPDKYYPAYDKKAGYEIAGFVWFQGYNDMIDHPYRVDPADKKSPMGDYSEYSRLMACFIRDVRKDLSAPDMRFVIGAIGIGGDTDPKFKDQPKLAQAQAAPAAMPEFKGNVGVVYTAKYWDHRLGEVVGKARPIQKWIERRVREKKREGWSKDEQKAYREKFLAEKLTEEEREMLKGVSNEPFHYLGSAKIIGRIGKAFAEAMIALEKK